MMPGLLVKYLDRWWRQIGDVDVANGYWPLRDRC